MIDTFIFSLILLPALIFVAMVAVKRWDILRRKKIK